MSNRLPFAGRCWTAGAALVCALMLFAAACGGGDDETEDTNCIFGVASNGECVNSDPCFFPSDCLPGFSCQQGTCAADQECTADADCDAGVCGTDGACVNPDTCTSNDECVSKTFCADSGECLPDPCENVTCTRGTCEPGSGQCTSKESCTDDNELFDCVQGERCLNDSCRTAEEFCNELTCDRGVCDFGEGSCVAADDCGGDDSQCLEGQYCNANNECAADKCVTNSVTCDDGVCMPMTGECQNAETCSSNDECLGDHWCIEGTCELQSMACGDADGDGGCFGNQSCVYDDSSQTASCESPDVCTTSLDCLDGTQCGGDSCITLVTCEDDLYEPNNSDTEATVFTDVARLQQVEASLCASDTDVYTLNVGDLEPTAVRGLLSINLRYATRDIGLGELQVELLEEQTDGSYTSVATETAGMRGQDGGVEFTHEIGPSTVGAFRIEVTGVDDISDAGISYDLGVDIIDDLVVDACEGARVIEDGDILTADMRQANSSLLRQSCATGTSSTERAEQVFVFDVDQASRVDVTVVPEVDTEDPVLSLRESCATSGTEVACSDSGSDAESLEAVLLDPGTYYVVVSAAPNGSLNRYDLSLSMTAATCASSSSYCEDATSAQICFGGTGFQGVDCSNGCNPTTGRCFPIQGNTCATTTAITAASTETITWGELTNDYEPSSSCVSAANGSNDTSGPDKAFQITVPDQKALRATISVGTSEGASLYVVEDCQDADGTCLAGVNETAGGDETITWPNRTGGDATVFLIADSSNETLLGDSTLDIEFVDLVCDPQGSDAAICDPNNSEQVLECGEFGVEYTQGEDCGSWSCGSGACLRPDTCAGALDVTTSAASGGTTVVGQYDNFTDDYSGDACGVTSGGSDGGDLVLQATLADGEVLTGDAVVTSGSAWPSMVIMPTCGAFDDTCLAGVNATTSTAEIEYKNVSGSTETVFLFIDNDGFSGDFEVTVEITNPVCGNNTIEPGEQCDDGNTAPGDACDANCQIEVICGDGFLRGSEECDDGNLTNGDGCNDSCEIEPNVCGNTIIEPANNEECDDGDTVNGLVCSATCTLNTPTTSVSNAPAIGIPDNTPAGITDTLSVTGCATVDTVIIPLEITHTWIGDLLVTLTDPNGTTVVLHDETGSSADDISGTYPLGLTPAESLDAFDGVSGNGDWVLSVSDNSGIDTGTLDSWGLDLYCQ